MRKSAGDHTFDVLNAVFLFVFAISTLYPFVYVFAISFNDAMDSMSGGIYFFPRKWSFDSYRLIFQHEDLVHSFLVSTSRTVIGAISSVAVTAMLGYVFTKKEMPGYKVFYTMSIISMFLGGGLIPTFMLYRWVHVYNTFWVYIVPGLIGIFNMILFRTYFMQLPSSLEESAFIDGANEMQCFTRIILPLSTPILATIGLFVAVGHWNSWTDTLFFTANPNLETLQFVLMKIIRQSEAAQIINAQKAKLLRMRVIVVTPESIKMAITVVATVPILCVYPFLQKYFVKGVMIGALKG